MSGRKRNIQIKFRVTEEERDMIYLKMKELPTQNMGAYLRKMAIDGYVINVDFSEVKKMTSEIHKIGVNINQIAHRINASGNVYQNDMDCIKEGLDKIWRLQRSNLLNLR